MSTSEALSDASMEALLAKAKASAESAMSEDTGTVAAPDAAVTDVVADAPAAPAFDPTSLLPLALMMGWKKLGIDTSEGTDALLYCQAAFVTAVALCAIIIVVIQRKAAANSTPGLLTVVEEGVEVKKTVSEHDLGEVKALQMQVLIPAALITVLHLKWGFVQPLPIQALVMPLTVYKHKLTQVYLRGFKAVGDLKRPWLKPVSGLEKALGVDPNAVKEDDAAKKEN